MSKINNLRINRMLVDDWLTASKVAGYTYEEIVISVVHVMKRNLLWRMSYAVILLSCMIGVIVLAIADVVGYFPHILILLGVEFLATRSMERSSTAFKKLKALLEYIKENR